MTAQFKKFLIGLFAFGLGIITLVLLVFFAIPEDSGLAGLGFIFFYFSFSIGGMFIYYILLKRIFFRGAVDQIQPQVSATNKTRLIIIGILAALIQTPVLSLIAFLLGGSNIDFIPVLGLPLSMIGFFLFPYILTRPSSLSKRLLFSVSYFFLPLIIGILIALSSV